MNPLAMALYTAFLLVLWTGHLAALAGVFHGKGLLVLALAIAVWILRRWRTAGAWMDRWTGTAMLVAVTAACLSWPPGDAMQLQWDPAIYAQAGAVLAREGGMSFPLEVLQELPRILRDLVAHPGPPLAPYAGMVVDRHGDVAPVAHPLFPVWLAYLYSVGGVDGLLSGNIVLLGLSALLAFALVRRWMGPGWGLVAAILMTFSPVQWWQARFTTAELLSQVLFLGGFLYLDHALERRDRWVAAAWIAGASFGLAFLARFDALLVLVPLLMLLAGLLADTSRRSMVLILAALMLVGLLQLIFHSRWFGIPYFPRASWVVAGLVFAGVALAGQYAWTMVARSPGPWWLRPAHAVVRLGGLLWLGFVLAAWLVRPWLPAGIPWPDAFVRIWSGPDAANMEILAAVSGWPMVVLAVSGLAALWMRVGERMALRCWLAVSMAVWAVLVFALHHEREMMWLCRRFIPVVVPAIAIGATGALWVVDGCVRSRRFVRVFSFCIAIGMMAYGVREPLHRVWDLREFEGAREGYARLAGQIDPDALVVADITGVAAVLRTMHGLDAVELHAPTMDRRDLLLRWLPALVTPRPVVLVTPIPIGDLWTGLYRDIGSSPFRARVVEQPEADVPVRSVEIASPFILYEVVPYASGDAEGRAP